MTRVLIVGVGSIGERHLRCFAATGRAEVSLCEVNEPLRRAVAERYQVREVYPDLEAGLDRVREQARGSRQQAERVLVS